VTTRIPARLAAQIKNSRSGEPIGIELLAYRPGDDRFDSVHVDVGGLKRDVLQPSGRA
jgi:hypothetical protein